jgi:probable addiction module antidote protein
MLGGGTKGTQARDIEKASCARRGPRGSRSYQATKIIKLSELTEFDPSKSLDDDEAIADYIRLAIEKIGDSGIACGCSRRCRPCARNVHKSPQSAGLTREALYKALRPEAHPRFDTIQRSLPGSRRQADRNHRLKPECGARCASQPAERVRGSCIGRPKRDCLNNLLRSNSIVFWWSAGDTNARCIGHLSVLTQV